MAGQPPENICGRDLAFAFTLACLLILPGLWSTTLIDPWEGHYAEVARRILQDQDWIRLSWQSEAFRSKPALTPWLIAGSMKLHGLAVDGGFSGEFLVSPGYTAWVVRLPFALFGIGGLLSLWVTLMRLVSRRAAYIGLLVLGTTPFYSMVARQAITDMPMVATTSSAICFFVLALQDGDRPLRRILGRLQAHHFLLLLVAAVSIWQMVYNFSYFQSNPSLGSGMHGCWPLLWVVLPHGAGLLLLLILSLVVWPMRNIRDCYLLCTYALLGVSLLAKGPPGLVLATLVCLLYLLSTGQWRLLWRLRLLEGVLVMALIAAPWHVAMALRDGQPFITEYFGHHWLKRAGDGVHMVNRTGEGTFTYFVKQLGYGLWPFVGILPMAFLAAWRSSSHSPREHLRLLGLLWAVGALVLFTIVKTKFHHYIVPAMPGFALVLALWIDDLWERKIDIDKVALAFGLVVSARIGYDIYRHQELLLELFVYRYDRAWPSMAPWSVDLGTAFFYFGLLFFLVGLSLFWRRLFRVSAIVVLVLAVSFSLFTHHIYMPAAAPHWGQGQLHATYYQQREIYGVHLRYQTTNDLRADWPDQRSEFEVRSYISDNISEGDSLKLRISAAEHEATVMAEVTQIFDSAIRLRLLSTQAPDWRSSFEGQATTNKIVSPPQISIDADPLIAWNLHWRSELFWSAGELWSSNPTGHRMFERGHDKEFLALLDSPEFQGRTIYVITEASQGARLRSLLKHPLSKESFERIDQSSNKFSLYRFDLP